MMAIKDPLRVYNWTKQADEHCRIHYGKQSNSRDLAQPLAQNLTSGTLPIGHVVMQVKGNKRQSYHI